MKKLQILILMILLTTRPIATVSSTRSQTKKAERVAQQVKLHAQKKAYKLQRIAYHEAGHAVSNAYNYNLTVIESVTIQRNKNIAGRVNTLKTYPAVTLGIQKLENGIMTDLAGGVGDQIFQSENMLSNKKDILSFFSDHRYAQDIKSAQASARNIIMKTSPTLNEEQINLEIDVIIAALYQESYKFLTDNKNGVEKVAHALLEKKILSGNEIYNILDVPKPLMNFEQGPLPEKYNDDYALRNISAEYIASLDDKNIKDSRKTTIQNIANGTTTKREFYINGSIATITHIKPDKTKIEVVFDLDKKHCKNYYDANNKITKIIACNPDQSIISTKYFDTNGNEINNNE